jgi:hypothetical protein
MKTKDFLTASFTAAGRATMRKQGMAGNRFGTRHAPPAGLTRGEAIQEPPAAAPRIAELLHPPRFARRRRNDGSA